VPLHVYLKKAHRESNLCGLNIRGFRLLFLADTKCLCAAIGLSLGHDSMAGPSVQI